MNPYYRITLFVVSFIGIINFKKSNLLFRLLTFYLIYTLVSEHISMFFSYWFKNNSLVQKIYLCVEIIFMGCIYYLLMKGRLQKKIIAFFSGILLIVSLISFLLNTEAVMPSYLITIESLMLLVFSILFFYQLLDHPYEQNLLTMGEFWLNSSVCMYCMGSFFFWASFYYLYRHHIVLPGLKVIMDTLDILHYLLLGLAIFFYSRRESLIMHEHSKR